MMLLYCSLPFDMDGILKIRDCSLSYLPNVSLKALFKFVSPRTLWIESRWSKKLYYSKVVIPSSHLAIVRTYRIGARVLILSSSLMHSDTKLFHIRSDPRVHQSVISHGSQQHRHQFQIHVHTPVKLKSFLASTVCSLCKGQIVPFPTTLSKQTLVIEQYDIFLLWYLLWFSIRPHCSNNDFDNVWIRWKQHVPYLTLFQFLWIWERIEFDGSKSRQSINSIQV